VVGVLLDFGTAGPDDSPLIGSQEIIRDRTLVQLVLGAWFVRHDKGYLAVGSEEGKIGYILWQILPKRILSFSEEAGLFKGSPKPFLGTAFDPQVVDFLGLIEPREGSGDKGDPSQAPAGNRVWERGKGSQHNLVVAIISAGMHRLLGDQLASGDDVIAAYRSQPPYSPTFLGRKGPCKVESKILCRNAPRCPGEGNAVPTLVTGTYQVLRLVYNDNEHRRIVARVGIWAGYIIRLSYLVRRHRIVACHG